MQGPKVQALKRQCSRLGLPTSGKKPELIERIQKHQVLSQEPPTPESDPPSDNIQCLVGTFIAADVSDTIGTAREELQKAARNDPLEEKYFSDDRTVIMNHHASFWARMEADLDQLKKEVGSLHRKTDDLERKNENLERKNEELERTDEKLRLQVAALEKATIGFRDFRHRFISTYKRDILNEMDSADWTRIQHGNTVVHSGNIKCDAELYRGQNCRVDQAVFRKLYGVLPGMAITIGRVSPISCYLLPIHAYLTSP